MPLSGWRLGWPIPAPPRSSGPVVLDLGPHCTLSESLAGYAAALGTGTLQANASALPRCGALIVPGATRLLPLVLDAITTCLDAGGLVILESGAGFAHAEHLAAHRASLRGALDVHVGPPVELWPQSLGAAVPYVDFTWPVHAKVRDFSRVVPVASGAGETIATVHGLAAGIRRRSGRGTLIVLGSPLGPALWAGDAAAQRWLAAVPNVYTVRER